MTMIRGRTTLGLSLLCSLLICDIAAESASAAPASKTTGFTCVLAEEGDFSDAHCDNKVAAKTGNFGHVAITEPTKLEITNTGTKNATKESTDSIFKGTILGTATEISCVKVSGEGTLTNEEPEAKVHKLRTVATLVHTGCKVLKPAGCTLTEPINLNVTAEGAEELGPKKDEMGIEFKPTGKNFAEITIKGCAIAGVATLEGTAMSTGTPPPTEKHTGATKVFNAEMTEETLKLAGKPAAWEAKVTVRMLAEKGVKQNPVSFTTVTT